VTDGSEISKQYPHPADDEDIRFITSVLHEMIADPTERAEIEKEAEALRFLEDVFFKKQREQAKALAEQAKVLAEQTKALEKKDKALVEQTKALEKKDTIIEEKDKALAEQAKQIEELKRLLGGK
jgi:uncharacterized protein (DUF3084 family)